MSSISVYLDSGNQATTLIAGVYSDSNGQPGALLASGSLSSPSAGGWNTVPVTPVTVTPGSFYWLAVLGQGGTLYVRDRQGGPCASQSSGQGLASLPVSWTAGAASNSCPTSAYVNGTLVLATASPPSSTVAPSISGQAEQGQTLTTSNGSWSNSPTSYAYQWEDCDSAGANCSYISGATSSTYALTGGDIGHTLRSFVIATNSAGTVSARSSQTAVATPAVPVNSAPPQVTGTPRQGSALATSDGSWSSSPSSYAYQWQDCDSSGASCTNIAGATASSYTLTGGDVDHTIRAVVVAANAGGSNSASSAATALVTPLPPGNTSLPQITGTAQQSSTLTTSKGSWTNSPTSYGYQWQDCDSSGGSCIDIPGATGSTYKLQSSDVGSKVDAVVTATNAGGSTPATSRQTAAVSTPATPTAAFTYSPFPPVANASTSFDASASTCAATPCTYGWTATDSGGTRSIGFGVQIQYTFTQATPETVTLTVTDALNRTATMQHSFTVQSPPPPPPSNTATPVVSGTTQQGQTLSTTNGAWNNNPTAYTYQWQRCSGSCSDISGATSQSYVLQAADVGQTIDVVVTATNAGGSASATSQGVGPVTSTGGGGGGGSGSFVGVCGSGLCVNGSAFRVKGATTYGFYDQPNTVISEARAAHLNTLELSVSNYQVLSDTEASDTWNTVDAYIAAAKNAGLHVILNLAEFGQAMLASGYNFSSTATGSSFPNLGWQGDWHQYLQFIANRVNTISGVTYKNDPTIAMVEVWGEIPAPDGSGGAPSCASTCWTAAQMQSFYANTMAQWHSLAPNILISSGGFSYLDYSSGIPWQNIMSGANNSVCDVEINSYGDRNTTTPNVTNYCHGIGKPWFLAAWSACSNPSGGSWDINDWQGSDPIATDTAMAAHVNDMYAIAGGSSPATYPAIGTDFWNLGTATYHTCDLGPNSPETPSRTWTAVTNAS